MREASEAELTRVHACIVCAATGSMGKNSSSNNNNNNDNSNNNNKSSNNNYTNKSTGNPSVELTSHRHLHAFGLAGKPELAQSASAPTRALHSHLPTSTTNHCSMYDRTQHKFSLVCP